MTREQVVQAIANVERELGDVGNVISQDTLIVLHRKLAYLMSHVGRHELPPTKPILLLARIEKLMTEESLDCANDRELPAKPKVSRPDPPTNPSYSCYACQGDIERDDEVWIDPRSGEATMTGYPYHVECAPNEEPCGHNDQFINGEGLVECHDCGHIFQPPPIKPTIDRTAAIGDLFGGSL